MAEKERLQELAGILNEAWPKQSPVEDLADMGYDVAMLGSEFKSESRKILDQYHKGAGYDNMARSLKKDVTDLIAKLKKADELLGKIISDPNSKGNK